MTRVTNMSALAAGVAGLASAAAAQFSDNFDSYATGSNIAGQGGWEIWYTGGSDGRVEGTIFSSAPNALRLVTLSDVVHRFTGVDDGVWEFSVMTYVPSSAPPGVGGSVILMNQYGSSGFDRWSMQIALNETSLGGSQPLPYMVESQFDRALLPLITDQWVELRALIDLDNDVFSTWYGGQLLTNAARWTDNGFGAGGGVTSIACVDLWSAGIDEIRFDNLTLAEACYPDCDTSTGVGVLDIFDFLCFQNLYSVNDPYACDCDISTGPGVCDIFDFLCFQNAYSNGCP